MPDEAKPSLKVFLCHASADKDVVHNLYESLVERGIDAWLDVEKLWPGMNWEEEITRAVKKTDVVVVCLSKNSINKAGFVQKEIVFALDKASEKPEGTIFLIPARLEVCDVPERLNRWQWVDLFASNGFQRLMGSLQRRATQLEVSLEGTGLIETEGLRQKLEYLYDEGLEAQWTEDWETACNRFETILNLQPGYRDTVSRLRLVQRNRRLNNLYNEALENKKSENWQKVVQLLEELTSEIASYEDSVQLLEIARKKVQAIQLYEEARRLYKAHKWKAVVKVFGQIAAIDSDYGDPDTLLPSSNEKVLELERLERIKALYHLAIREIDAGKWNEALDLLGKVQELDPNYSKTLQLVKKVQSELRKIEAEKQLQSQIDGLYEDAHRAFKFRRWDEALKIIENIRSLDRNFDDRDQIYYKAGKELKSEEERIRIDTQLQAMYKEAVSLLHEKQYQDALEKWQEIVAIDPQYADPQKVQRTSQKKLADLTNSLPNKRRNQNLRFIGLISCLIFSIVLIVFLFLDEFRVFARPGNSATPTSISSTETAVPSTTPIPFIAYEWKFETPGDLEQWGNSMERIHSIRSLQAQNGRLTFHPGIRDPYLYLPPLSIQASRTPILALSMKVSAGDWWSVYFVTTTDQELDEKKKVLLKVTADGSFHKYFIDMRRNIYWKGTVTTIRLDPDEVVADVEIDSFSVQNYSE